MGSHTSSLSAGIPLFLVRRDDEGRIRMGLDVFIKTAEAAMMADDRNGFGLPGARIDEKGRFRQLVGIRQLLPFDLALVFSGAREMFSLRLFSRSFGNALMRKASSPSVISFEVS